jgi:hypothetical protein
VVPTSTTFGPLFAERAVTIGRNKFNFGYTFQRSEFSTFEGQELDSGNLRFISQHNDCCPAAGPNSPQQTTDFTPDFERDLLQSTLIANIKSNTTAFFANYGVTNRFDVGVAVPIVNVSIDATVFGEIIRTATSANPITHSFDGRGQTTKTVSNSGSATGLGDILLRAKYNLFRNDNTAFAAALDLRLPTGNEDDLLGTGATRTYFFAIASGEYGRFSPHVNFGYTASSGESSADAADVEAPGIQFGPPAANVDTDPLDLTFPDEINYIVGVDFAAHPRVTVGFDLRGRTMRDVARFTVLNQSYPDRAPGARPTAPYVAQNEFSLETDHSNLNQLLGVVGGKINLGGTFLLNVSLLFQMNDAGLKAKATPVIGFDYVF